MFGNGWHTRATDLKEPQFPGRLFCSLCLCFVAKSNSASVCVVRWRRSEFRSEDPQISFIVAKMRDQAPKFQTQAVNLCEHTTCQPIVSSAYAILFLYARSRCGGSCSRSAEHVPWPRFSGATRSAGNLRTSAQVDEPCGVSSAAEWRSSLPRPRPRSVDRGSAAFLDNFKGARRIRI